MTDTPAAERLTQADVERLLTNPSPRTRARTTAKIAAQFDARVLSPAERRIAEDIFRTLVKDTGILVREALAAHLKSTPDPPLGRAQHPGVELRRDLGGRAGAGTRRRVGQQALDVGLSQAPRGGCICHRILWYRIPGPRPRVQRRAAQWRTDRPTGLGPWFSLRLSVNRG